jgi:hypothetical protein
MMTRYLSGLCVAGLGLCGGGWLVVAAVAFGGESAGPAGRVNLLTGAVLIAVSGLSLVCWSRAWRQRLRADGVLADRFPQVPRREARRNRRALSRDVRRAAKLAERSARGARRAARRSARLASGGALSEGGVLGEGVALGVASAGDEQYNARAGNPGERAAELISELRSMLEPLLAATEGEPALAEQLAAASPLPQRSRFASELRPRATAPEMAMPRARPAPMSIPRLASAADDNTSGPASDCEDAWW